MFYLLIPKSAPIILLLGILAPLLWLGSSVRYLRPFGASGLTLTIGGVGDLSADQRELVAGQAQDAYRSVLSFIVAAVGALFTAVAAHRACMKGPARHAARLFSLATS